MQNLIDRQVFRGTEGDDEFSDTGENDTIYCGKGNDKIRGTTGDDTFIYSTGDGFDRIIDYSIWADSYDTVRFSEDILPDDIYAEKAGRYMLLFIRDMTSGIAVLGVEEFVFADGTVWKEEEVLSAAKDTAVLRSQYCGDLNGDGSLTAEDAQLLLDYLICSAPLAPDAALRADMNSDGHVSAVDLTLLKQRIL